MVTVWPAATKSYVAGVDGVAVQPSGPDRPIVTPVTALSPLLVKLVVTGLRSPDTIPFRALPLSPVDVQSAGSEVGPRSVTAKSSVMKWVRAR